MSGVDLRSATGLGDDEETSSNGRGGAQVDPHESVESLEPTPREAAPHVEPHIEASQLGTEVEGVAEALGDTGLESLAGDTWAARAAAEPVLRDIADAGLPALLLPPDGLESIIGADERQRVTNTRQFPYSAIASLEITAADGSVWVGTGWFISPRTLITAGHCVYIHSSQYPGANGWVRSIRVIPGRDGEQQPFGSVVSTTFRSVAGWTSRADPEYDYGAIILPEGQDLGTRVGIFGLAVYGDADLQGMMLNVTGYPGDKIGAERGTLWHGTKKAVSVSPNKVFYDIDTMGGQSGAPVYRVTPEDARVAVAVHAYGTAGSVRSNSGTRINERVLARLQAWKA